MDAHQAQAVFHEAAEDIATLAEPISLLQLGDAPPQEVQFLEELVRRLRLGAHGGVVCKNSARNPRTRDRGPAPRQPRSQPPEAGRHGPRSAGGAGPSEEPFQVLTAHRSRPCTPEVTVRDRRAVTPDWPWHQGGERNPPCSDAGAANTVIGWKQYRPDDIDRAPRPSGSALPRFIPERVSHVLRSPSPCPSPSGGEGIGTGPSPSKRGAG